MKARKIYMAYDETPIKEKIIMNEKLTAVAASAKNFVIRHKTKIAVVATAAVTATAVVALQRSAVKDWNEFLEKHDLVDEYYSEYEETDPAIEA